VLFADIRGFTAISEHAAPEKIVSLLNRYFSAMTDIIFAHGGTLDKYLGDGLMALFWRADHDAGRRLERAQRRRSRCQRRILGINMELRQEGLAEIGVGIGLHTGEVIVGYVGSERRSEYTAIGDSVNTASRLESNARGGQILVSDATAKLRAADTNSSRAIRSLSKIANSRWCCGKSIGNVPAELSDYSTNRQTPRPPRDYPQITQISIGLIKALVFQEDSTRRSSFNRTQ